MPIALLFVAVAVALAVGDLADAASIRRHLAMPADRCDSKIYCTGELLKTVQLAEIFNDSKTYVDLSQINDPDVTLENFAKLMNATGGKPNRTQLMGYLSENFVMRGELENWTLPDWQEELPLSKNIQDPRYRQWAIELNGIWKKLARKINDDVATNPNRHSLIYVKNGFIVPGGRFKEFYYWDSYWVIEGLLICGMHETAKGMIDNFLAMVEKFGFVPNGGRVYYLMRSQPPMLIPMVSRYLEFTKDHGYLSKVIGTLDKEFAFWQHEKTVEVRKAGKTYTMARYTVDSDGPRPESYREDYNLAQQLPEDQRRGFYNNIKAAAESGWDFSSRWFIRANNDSRQTNLSNISTESIVPVDLNALLQRNARTLAEYHTLLGHSAKARDYAKLARSYQDGIDDLLWNEERGTWLDYDIDDNRARDQFYPSNLTPLYTMSYNLSNARDIALRAVKYLKSETIDTFFGGTPASLNHTGEQWDFPNAWPPLQSFIVLGLYRTGVREAVGLAAELAGRWLRANYIGYDEYGKMFEKYDAILPGGGGGGGEYTLQDGFGWTNGVAFEFLHTFPASTSADANDALSADMNYNNVHR